MKPGRVEDLLRTKPPDEPDYRGQLALDRVATKAVRSQASPRAGFAWAGLRSPALVVLALGIVVGAVLVVGSAVPKPMPTQGPSAAPVASAIGMIPWIDATPVPSPTVEPTIDPLTLPACQPGDLALVAGGWGGATGSMAGGIVLINVSANACRVVAKPSVELVDATGRVIAGAGAGAEPSVDLVALPAGAGAGAVIVWSNWCQSPPQLPLRVRATPVVGGATLAADVRAWEQGGVGVPRCDDPVGGSTFGVATPLTSPGPSSGGSQAQSCAAGQLVAFSGGWGAAMGTMYAELVLFNAGGVDCTLPAVPTLQLRDARGHLVASTGPPQRTSDVVIPAASTAVASVGFSDWCVARPDLPLRLDLLIGATTLSVNAQPAASPNAVIPVPACMSGLATPPPSFFYNSRLTVLGSSEPPAPDPADYLPITVTVSPLATVRAGSVMAYSVMLTNIDAYQKPMNLAAFCPSYVERLFLPGRQASIDTELALNCSAASVMPGGGHLTFEMRLPIPSDAAPGQATLVWQLGQRGGAAKVLFTIGP